MTRKTLALALAVALVGPAATADDAQKLDEDARARAGGIARPYRDPNVPGVDLSGLSGTDVRRLIQILRSEPCPCGCGMNLLQCRREDPDCPTSPGLARSVASALRAGRSDEEIRAALGNAAPSEEELSPLGVREYSFTLAGAPSRGPADAAVTVVEFSDFQCAYCALAQSWLKDILTTYPDDVRLVFKHFPSDGHEHAALAARAAVVAHEQGKFWELHDKMFTHMRQLDPDHIQEWAGEVGLESGRFRRALATRRYGERVALDRQEGEKAGVASTPTFFINGRRLLERPSYKTMRRAIEEQLGAALAADPGE